VRIPPGVNDFRGQSCPAKRTHLTPSVLIKNSMHKPSTDLRLLISNGSHHMHLIPLADSLNKSGYQVRLFVFLYPRKFLRLVLCWCKLKSWKRFLNRATAINDSQVYDCRTSQIITLLADRILNGKNSPVHDLAYTAASCLYSRKAVKILSFIRPQIYHFRSGYGGCSIHYAHENNVITLCDHSYGHPVLTKYMIRNCGRYPTSPDLLPSIPQESFSKKIQKDLELSEFIVVNSNFVKENLAWLGFDASRIFTAYPGIEKAFFKYVESSSYQERSEMVLFAGTWEQRKGINAICNLIDSSTFQISIAGCTEKTLLGVTPRLKNSLFKLRILGYLSWQQLANEMLSHRVFVFPSLSEGSARVVSMALACGCFVITTPNAGSIVKHGINGYLVDAWDIQGFISAVHTAIALDDGIFQKISSNNMSLFQSVYTQEMYAKRISEVYESILSGQWCKNLDDSRISISHE
jgi:glycosyltransferase involved in cell wall biosynthesis